MDQLNITLLGDVKRGAELQSASQISSFESPLQALQFQVRHSNLKQEYIASALGIDRGHFSRMLDGSRHLPLNKIPLLNELTGTCELTQRLAYESGLDLVKSQLVDQQKEIERLKALVKAS